MNYINIEMTLLCFLQYKFFEKHNKHGDHERSRHSCPNATHQRLVMQSNAQNNMLPVYSLHACTHALHDVDIRSILMCVLSGSMQKLDSGLDWTMDWTLDWTLDSMYFSSYRPCHHKYSPSSVC